jgi:hypothetical protein
VVSLSERGLNQIAAGLSYQGDHQLRPAASRFSGDFILFSRT